jgi:hypothetical protein
VLTKFCAVLLSNLLVFPVTRICSNAVYVVSGKVSARVQNVDLLGDIGGKYRNISENVARPQKNTKTLIFFNFLNL